MPSRRQHARIAKSRASKMWMESLEQRQLLAPISGEVSALPAGEVGMAVRQSEESVVWMLDFPREQTAPRRDEDGAGSDGVVVLVL